MNLDVILLVLHVFLAIIIVALILLQKGKGATAGATFGGGGGGGGGASAVFGASGASNFLSKTTAILATAFFLNSLALAYLAANRDIATSVVDSIGAVVETEKVIDTLDAGVPLPADAVIESDVPAAVEIPADGDVPAATDVSVEAEEPAATIGSDVPSAAE